MAKRIGVILSGCGVYDGSEVHETVVTLPALDRAGPEAAEGIEKSVKVLLEMID